MKNIILIVLICYEVVLAQNTPVSSKVYFEDTCQLDLFIANRTRELECCQNISENLYLNWPLQGAYLTRTLATLQAWSCPQFNEACSNRSLDFTDYTSLIYDRFCNQSSLLQRCGSVVNNALSVMGLSEAANETNWISLTNQLKPNRLTVNQLEEPCLQAALYDAYNVSRSNYHEIITMFVPYCSLGWCGFDYDTILREEISPWMCLPKRCKATIIILMVLYLVLALIIVVANFTVILVYSTEKKLRHSQGIFRLSLGFSDVLVGLVVLPLLVYKMWNAYQGVPQLGETMDGISSRSLYNGDGNDTYNAISIFFIQKLETIQTSLKSRFSKIVTESFGFFTTLSLTVSIYLLTASGIDRLHAVSRPFEYRQQKAIRFAIISSVFCWVLTFVLAVSPTFIKSLFYVRLENSFVMFGGRTALFVYLGGLFLPLVITWIVAVVMYFQAKKSFKQRGFLTTLNQKHFDKQRKLNKILALMVIVFSICILPNILVSVLVLFIPGTNPRVSDSYNIHHHILANSLETTSMIILMTNSLWNCLIYSMRIESFQETAIKKYKKFWNYLTCKLEM